MGLVRRTAGGDGPPPPPAGPRELIAALADPDPDRRRRAALDLGGVGEAVQPMLGRLAVEPDPAVRDALLTGLAAADDPVVAEALITHVASEDPDLRVAAVEALATMPHGVVPVLGRLVAHPDHDVRILTAMVLADLHHPDAASWLVEMISTDRHPNVVAAAIDALLPAAGPEHVGLLERVRERFPDDPFLRFTIDAALPRLAEVGA